jgi:hypothetical protein
MDDRRLKIARAIHAFAENPATNLVKGIMLILIGFSEASKTLREDIMDGHLRVGHGLILLGFFSILDTVPRFLEGVDAGQRYLVVRQQKTHSQPGSSVGPDQGGDQGGRPLTSGPGESTP